MLASAVLAAAASGSAIAQAGRDYIYIVGSSTVYPFSTVVAERFGRGSEFKTPKVESTGVL
jgi:phosphate transport system substrate-binding protein